MYGTVDIGQKVHFPFSKNKVCNLQIEKKSKSFNFKLTKSGHK